ncbi:MAG: peptide deformylase [Lachnospiraceae bacterium]|nr:peptide deformylase [Lachnospiraceae bacterium]
MAIRNLRYDGDPILRKISKEVKEVTPRIEELIDDMFETMEAENGCGLAGPQVGVLKRIFVIDVGDGPMEFINPVILEKSGSQTGGEGCLSLPGKIATVTRPNHVVCEAYDRHMNKFRIEGEELLARAICHEYDHLDGVLYKDVADGPLCNVDDYEEE